MDKKSPKIGDIVEVEIIGMQDYGAFVKFFLQNPETNEKIEQKGLIHISEISERFVRDGHTYVKVNERVKVNILDVDEDGMHFKLSLKAVEANKARSMRKRRFVHELPQMNIGFTSLAEHLDQWIEEATK